MSYIFYESRCEFATILYMTRLLKTEVQRRTNALKQLILDGKPFEETLARLYMDLSLQAKHTWVVEVYKLLLLYLPETEQARLYHSALFQALLLTNQWKEADTVARVLQQRSPKDPEIAKLCKALRARKEGTLPAYTPLAALSHYTEKQKNKAPSRSSPELPVSWKKNLQQITAENLAAHGYYQKIKQLNRWPKAYRPTLLNYFDELFINYLFQQKRSVVVLGGALLEILLAVYFYEKYQMRKIPLGKQTKTIFELTLHDLLNLANQKQIFSANTLRLCRAARMQRNFIHPGKEILEKDILTSAGAQICFLAVMETIDALS